MIPMFHINLELPVIKDFPENGIQVGSDGLIIDFNKYVKAKDRGIETQTYYYCPQCKGYIEGYPGEYGENSIGPLCGRCGTAYYCKRCGYELSFYGYVS